MSHDTPDPLGRVDDQQEEAAEPSTGEGAAARGDYDPAQGSPGSQHPTGEAFPDEAVRYDDPDARPRSATTGDQPDNAGAGEPVGDPGEGNGTGS